jgi:hypothetical protein
MLELFFFTLGTSSLLIAYFLYGLATRRGVVVPNRASWMIWSATTTTEALTYNAINAGAAQNIIFLLSSMACIAVTISVWRHSRWERPTALESICMALCIAALILWLGYQDAFWAHIMLLVAIPISYLPMLVSLRKDPSDEQTPAWGLWTIADISMLAFVMISTKGHGTDLPYIIIELCCHICVWVLIGFTSINPFNSFRIVGAKILMQAKDPETGRQFLLGRNHVGKAVYAGQGYQIGDDIIRFKGQVFHRDHIPASLHDAEDRFLQIGLDTFIGPSDGIDDLFNHSCAPNAGIRFAEEGPVLIALGPIQVGDELTFDYSTTIIDHQWSMVCQCGARTCRGSVGEFTGLPVAVKARYIDLGIVPDYILRALPNSTPLPQ